MRETSLAGVREGDDKVVAIDFSKVVKTDIYISSISEDKSEFNAMLSEAHSELNFYNWCSEILESYVGIFVGGVVGVFLFKIKPGSPDVDEWLWVIVGDLPPIYLTCDDSPNAACALDSYIGTMQEWVEAAECGDSVADLVPVNVPATPENASKLKSRLAMLDERVLNLYEEDLKA
ncbi:TPA: hypothetical protein LMR99_004141 [Vibrio alginolyticus]|nr:hypothetical protein [Vibrio alginolyticus]HBK5921555.1 hypothetical protein [Vibrio alginolyticus]HBK6034451.1 hypothetical protein [Vibrio alginolyticus]